MSFNQGSGGNKSDDHTRADGTNFKRDSTREVTQHNAYSRDSPANVLAFGSGCSVGSASAAVRQRIEGSLCLTYE